MNSVDVLTSAKVSDVVVFTLSVSSEQAGLSSGTRLAPAEGCRPSASTWRAGQELRLDAVVSASRCLWLRAHQCLRNALAGNLEARSSRGQAVGLIALGHADDATAVPAPSLGSPPRIHPHNMASFSATAADLPSPAESAKLLRSLLPEALHRPVIAIVCGSGLAGLADLLEDRVDLEYTKIGFPSSTGTC